MVPVAETPLLELVAQSLERHVRRINAAEPVVRAFAAWLGLTDLVDANTIAALAAEAAAREGSSRSYRDVAVLGFAVSCADGTILVQRFCDGLQWMRARRFFVPNQALGFEADALAIFGTALGVRALAPSADRDGFSRWLTDLATKSLQQIADALDGALLRASFAVCDRGIAAIQAPDLTVVLASKRLIPPDERAESDAQRLILDLTHRDAGADRAATQLAALRWLLRSQARLIPTGATADDVARMLETAPHALKRWPWEDRPRTRGEGVTVQRWDVQHEYHFQSLLWALLVPVFPDLDDEEWLPSVGHKHPRVDLVIPSLKLMIEAKFLREGTQAALADMIEQIAADTALYLSEREDHRILVAVWDDSRSVDQHTELRMGIGQLKGVLGSVVVSRPGSWAREPAA